MRGWELVRLLKHDWQTRRFFHGVYSCDGLPKTIKLGGTCHAFIINLDPITKPGSHWVGLYIDFFGRAVYFDPFGIGPFQQDIYNFIKANSFTLTVNHVVLQNFQSRNCGLFCVYFIKEMCRGRTLPQIVAKFNHRHTILNDRYLQHLLRLW